VTRTGRTAAGAGALVPLLATGLVLALGTLGATPALAAPHPTSGHPRHAVAPTSAAPALRPLPTPHYGVTVDDVADLGGIVASTEALPSMPTTRITFDVHEPASYYAPAVHALHPVSYLMGELLDSSESRKIGVAAYARRVASYLAAFDGLVDVWEIGNEVNGDWTGRYGTVAAKLVRAYDEVAGAGQRSALTLYDNVGCGDGPRELDPLALGLIQFDGQVACVDHAA